MDVNLGGLNEPQRDAVTTLRGPLLVLAGAGTGKTRVVTFRIANLIRHGIRPERILAVTFTNKAAAEMRERVGAMLGPRTTELPRVSTFHSHCVQILRRHIRHLGYPEKFAIYDRGDQESVARSVLREIRVPTESLRPGDLLNFISHWKTHAVRPDDAAATACTDKQHLAAAAYRRYQKVLKNAGAVDFDDLLLCTEDLFARCADVRREEAQQFDHLLIDEYQDTNASQYRIVKALTAAHRNLCVVGDDDQSIYGWRGAEVQHILNFHKDWPDAKLVRLEQNYRSTAEILKLANRLIAFNKLRHDKVLIPARPGGERPRVEQYKDETDEAKSVVARIRRDLQQDHIDPRDIAILFRTNEQPRPFETELRKADIPYVVIGGMSFFDRKEVKDILAYLRVLQSPDDEVSLLRIINTPPRGIGAKAVDHLTSVAVASGQTVWQLLTASGTFPKLPATAATASRKLVELIRRYQSLTETGNLTEVVRSLIAEVRYEEELLRLYPDPHDRESRMNAVEEVVNALAAYERSAKKPSLGAFLDDVALGNNDFDNEKDKQLARNAVVLMTMHSAKGLEFPYVFMVGLEEGILPHHRSVKAEETDAHAIDEERRLCYVGVTRAQERLTLSLALTRMKWGKPRDTIPSRFLFELIGEAEKASPARKKTGPVKKRRRAAKGRK